MKTAFITGASGGIGLELTKIFATNGCNLILVARSEDRLKEIAEEFSSTNITVDYYAKDLSILENAKEIVADLSHRNIKIDYVVNNAGFGIDGRETEIRWERELEMLNLNMITLTYLTKVFASTMVVNGGGRILNISSIGGFISAPFMAGYCATKAYVMSFSEAVNFELKGTGVSVTTLCPGVTDTAFHAVAQTQQTSMYKLLPPAKASEVAAYGYRIMMKGQRTGVHGWSNKITLFMLRLLPKSLIIWGGGRMMSQS